MNILIVHNKYAEFGGEDAIVEKQRNIFNNNGENVYLYTKDNKNIEKYSKKDKIKLIKNAYSSQVTRTELTEIISRFKPDVAHVHNIYPLLSPIVYDVLKENRIPIVQTLHNYRFICPNGLMYCNNKICEKCLETNNYYSCFINKCYRDSYAQSFWYSDIIAKSYKRGSFENIDSFVALNPFMKDMMKRKGFDERKITIIPNCVEYSDYDINYKKQDYYIYIGRLSTEKGIMTLIRAMRDLRHINLKIIGDGPLRKSITEYISEHNLINIEMLGFKKGNEKNELIAKAKALIVPSEWYENFPTVVLEAFSLGTLVIASNIGGLHYMVQDNINGLKFKPTDSKDLKDKIQSLEENIDEVINMSRNASFTFNREYNPEAYYLRHRELYNNLILLNKR